MSQGSIVAARVHHQVVRHCYHCYPMPVLALFVRLLFDELHCLHVFGAVYVFGDSNVYKRLFN